MVRAGEEFAGFLIERRLGGGGMGEVFLARHPRLPRLIAIKLLARELASQPETRARFEREAELIARLDHPNIVTVHDRGVADGRLWIAMQYVDGGDAASLDPFTLPPAEAVHIIAETAKALDYAHVRGVIHRDVKPANILLTRPLLGQERRILLTDFGIGRLRDDSAQITRSGVLAATITYASPEQLSGAAPDYRSDQYSLACTLFRLLTGSTPFQADTVAAVVAGHLQHPVPKVSDRRPELPAALDAVLARGLAKRPEDRFESCRAFADAAAQALLAVSESTVTPIPEVSDAARAVTSAGDVIGGRAGATSALATLPASEGPTVSDTTSLPANSPSKPKRARWVAAGAAALAAVVTAAVGILWATKDHGPANPSGPAVVVEGPQAGVYPGFGPFLQIDAQGRRTPAPTSVEDPANDGRLPCAPVSIAAALPLSGKNSDLGESLLGAVRLAVSQFVQGGNQVCPVTIKEFDTGGDQAKAAQTAQRIAADKSIVAVIGPAMSPEVMGAGQTLEDSGLPFLSPVATNPVLAQSGWSGFFRGLANDNVQGPALGRYLATTAAFSRVCALRDTGGGYEGPLSTAVIDGLGAAAVPECKLSIDMGGDLTDAIATVAAARPDAVFYAGYPRDAAALLSKLRSAGVTATFVLGDGSFDPLFRDTAGALAAGTVVTCGCGPATDRLLTDYRAATGKSATANIVEAYDLTAIVLRGIVSGHTKRTDLREYLHAYHADGIAHSYAWTAAGEPADPRIWLYRLS
ncbi:bifunctional serine/threonine-protein kinase/ABC transporter substrate-binding protein [Nocardia sp. CDC160]|uniref:bifunctional serine/threonine-protein kinase/ABC transporter substrate-binding protein n=1 Tax=Nocardia sp. CDC160 TaxID=3112166 RepID=UPI002DBF3498|nr:bifunctional serine/threonine-protein kinase/ABC transporter substrate-binding protein [Nocardia sp. CDC160]MEC3919106.1 bifunctional serine/threonine-protein kinase/ABC transporter substrate-binding protein [Nocardia sp. CDC160]